MAASRAGPWTSATATSINRRATAASASLDVPSCVGCTRPWHGSLGIAAVDCREPEWAVSLASFDFARGRGRGIERGRRKELLIVGRAGGSRPPAGARRPRVTTPRRPPQEETTSSRDGVLINGEIRAAVVRLLDEKQVMVGVVPIQEALQRSKDADLDLVMISPDADPPVVRIVDYSKFRYEQQKKKKDQQKKSLANRVELKELKMRYNIDKHDYDVRLRAAHRFLKSGDKVKVIVQFKGREFEFRDLANELFERFQQDTLEVAVVETKMTLEGRSLTMVLAPNKVALLKASTSKATMKGKDEKTDSDNEEGDDDDVDDGSEESYDDDNEDEVNEKALGKKDGEQIDAATSS